MTEASERVASRRALIYQYVLRKHYELKLSGIADDVFARIRKRVDAKIGGTVPDSVRRLTAAYENPRSENPEDWSNAVHGCRRILKDLADALFPPQAEVRTVEENGKEIKLGSDHYVNRLMAFIQDSAESKRFREIVGSHLAYLGDRLDSICQASHKGTHTTIVSPEEADRYVVYTYMLVGDVLSLRESSTPSEQAEPHSKP